MSKFSLGLFLTFGNKDIGMWKASIVCSVIGFIQGVIMVFAADSAPQQAAGAAMGMAWAVIPYCICRAIQQLKPQEVVIKQEVAK
ncbi:hypothetical protein [Pantoea sp. PNT01]|uniref:hypothetical protein n=1 Tax=Pantoea sp. PNT01 TaxID=2769271 RepID=UPI001CE1200D|nr:hypothetical protein [Pantoea sp. PNT01]